MANGSRGVDDGADFFGEEDGGALAVGAAARQAPDERRAAGLDDFGRALDAAIERHWLTINGRGRSRGWLRQRGEPRLGEFASALGVRDAATRHGQLKIIADAAANG